MKFFKAFFQIKSVKNQKFKYFKYNITDTDNFFSKKFYNFKQLFQNEKINKYGGYVRNIVQRKCSDGFDSKKS